MATQDLDRIRFITQYFYELQGLRYWVPLGLVTLAGGSLVYFSKGLLALFPAILFLGALLLTQRARRYYRVTFGEVDPQPAYPAGEVLSVSIFNPAGPTSRVQAFGPVTAMVRHFAVGAALIVALFVVVQTIPRPFFLIQGAESLGQHPQILPEGGCSDFPLQGLYWRGCTKRSPAVAKAAFAQTMYVLYGSIFLGIWIWRERRRSQGHHLALAAGLLGLAMLSVTLGFWRITPILDLLLPALVYPGIALLLCGSSMVLAGLLDHWQLVRAMGLPGTAREEEPS